LDLQVWVVDRMLNFEIIDYPDYAGLELQVFDDPSHGHGMVVRQGAGVRRRLPPRRHWWLQTPTRSLPDAGPLQR
jgi:hypothetical protein